MKRRVREGDHRDFPGGALAPPCRPNGGTNISVRTRSFCEAAPDINFELIWESFGASFASNIVYLCFPSLPMLPQGGRGSPLSAPWGTNIGVRTSSLCEAVPDINFELIRGSLEACFAQYITYLFQIRLFFGGAVHFLSWDMDANIVR